MDPEEAWKRKMNRWNERKTFVPLGGFSLINMTVCIIVFLAVWGLFQLRQPWALRSQQAIESALNDSVRMDEAAAWYESVFSGSPSWIPLFNHNRDVTEATAQGADFTNWVPPVKGEVIAPFSAKQPGIQIAVNGQQAVQASQAGRIIYVGHTVTGETVMIQHPDHICSIYGWLDRVAVSENDWVEKGDVLAAGVSEQDGKGVFYFSLKGDTLYMDPAEVMDFD